MTDELAWYVGSVIRQNGAWLVNVNDDEGNSSSHEEWTCAASLVVAKRLAVGMAKDLGYHGRHVWVEQEPGFWQLSFSGDRETQNR